MARQMVNATPLRIAECAQRLIALCRELDEELDGVLVPASAAAVLNGIRDLLERFDD